MRIAFSRKSLFQFEKKENERRRRRRRRLNWEKTKKIFEKVQKKEDDQLDLVVDLFVLHISSEVVCCCWL